MKNPRSSFHLPMQFLSAPKRRALRILYGFCRQADDAVDATTDAQESKKQLMALRAGIYNIYGNPRATAREPLAGVIQNYNLRRDYFDAILDGMEMDLGDEILRPKLETLSLYCYRVASCVGLLSLNIFGASGTAHEKFAIALGHALQLTNILRDVKEDAARGRIYLPLEWLAEAGIETIAPGNLRNHPEQVTRVCRKLAALAGRYFLEAEALSRLCDRRKLLPALLMRDIYRNMFTRICARDDFLSARIVRVGFFRTFGMVAGAARYLV